MHGPIPRAVDHERGRSTVDCPPAVARELTAKDSRQRGLRGDSHHDIGGRRGDAVRPGGGDFCGG
jgi:hypothetical protein